MRKELIDQPRVFTTAAHAVTVASRDNALLHGPSQGTPGTSLIAAVPPPGDLSKPGRVLRPKAG